MAAPTESQDPVYHELRPDANPVRRLASDSAPLSTIEGFAVGSAAAVSAVMFTNPMGAYEPCLPSLTPPTALLTATLLVGGLIARLSCSALQRCPKHACSCRASCRKP